MGVLGYTGKKLRRIKMRKIISVLVLIGLSFSIELRVPLVSSTSIAANFPADAVMTGTLTANKVAAGSGGINSSGTVSASALQVKV